MHEGVDKFFLQPTKQHFTVSSFIQPMCPSSFINKDLQALFVFARKLNRYPELNFLLVIIAR